MIFLRISSPSTWVLCFALILAVRLSASREVRRTSIRFHERDKDEKTHRDDWAYPVVALRNRREHLVRLYGDFLQDVVGNNTDKGEVSSLASCSFSGVQEGRRKTEEASLKHPLESLLGEDEYNTPSYIIDCEDPGDWATEVVLRLKDGTVIGRPLKVTEMETERKGSWAACSQPLHTDRDFLSDWVDHQFMMGASKVYLHAPKGPHIDELFDDRKRHKRIKYNENFAERSADNVGTRPLQRFQKKNVEWVEYYPSPTASYYAEELIFTACHYRNRYAYNYSSQFDIDEFWVPGPEGEKTLPEFLDKRMPEDATAAVFFQVLYPMSCRTRSTGDYASRYSLHQNGTSQEKVAVRPFSMRRMHVHGMLDTSPEWKAAHPSYDGPRAIGFNVSQAYLKHIRPDNWRDAEKVEHHYECKFGQELDAENWNAIDK